jgi:hypothetical protein
MPIEVDLRNREIHVNAERWRPGNAPHVFFSGEYSASRQLANGEKRVCGSHSGRRLRRIQWAATLFAEAAADVVLASKK